MKKFFIGIAIILSLGVKQGLCTSPHIPDLVGTVSVYVIPGPLYNGIVTGPHQTETDEIVTFTALPLSGTHSLWNVPLRYNENGEVIATRTFDCTWSSSGGRIVGTLNNTLIWEAPEVEEATTVTIRCVISEGTVTIGRPFSFTYGPRTATTQLTILVVPPIPHTVKIKPSAATMTVGGTQTFIGEISNKQGRIISLPSHRYNWETSIGTLSTIGTQALFFAGTRAGTGFVSLRIKDTPLIGTAAITVLPGIPTTVKIVPSTATVAVGGTASFRIETYDSYNNFIEIPGNWTLEPEIGTLSSYFGTETIFTAGETEATGTLKVEIDDLEQIATITVFVKVEPVLTRIVLTPSSITAKVTGSATVVATGYNQYGDPMEIETQLFWGLEGIEGTITPIGTNTILIEFGTKSGVGTLIVSAPVDATTTITATITITLDPDECVKVFFKPIIHEVHIGPGGNTEVGTFTEGTFTIHFKDKYGNNALRRGTWTIYFNFNKTLTQEAGVILFPTTTHPYPEKRIIYVEPGELPFEVSVKIDSREYGGPFYIRLSLFKRPYDPTAQ